ncbi:MAG: PSD1 and planctomycete cytochrome C domain-containing protein [Verrucomicrobiales bacterium]
MAVDGFFVSAPFRRYVGWVMVAWVGVASAGPIDFNRDVRLILSDTCFACHGPDEAAIKGGLRLDSREAARRGGDSGEPAIVPGNPEASAVLARVLAGDPDDVMPPADSNKPRLSEQQVAVLRQWIREGAGYQGHWAFSPPVRPPVPEVVAAHADRLAGPIDAFVIARLEKEGISPSPEADRATLIRRVTLDLTGLPPTPDEVRAYLQDTAPEAWERVVDRLLASPHYGEMMAISWLDMARFADSNGYQTDSSRQMWPWRDWVIRAFNQNIPFDQFTIEQVAGDLLPHATRDQRIASGFNRNHRLNGEGGLIQAEWFVETVIDRVETTGSTWMALTLNCARCHDHKYDPISQKEFYSLFAFFNSVDESGILQGDGRNTPPLISLPSREQDDELGRLKEAASVAAEALKTAEATLAHGQDEWERGLREVVTAAPVWTPVRPVDVASAQGSLLVHEDESVVFAGNGPQPETDVYTLTVETRTPVTSALRLELLPDDRLPSRGPGRHANGNPILSEIILAVEVLGQPPSPLAVAKVAASYDQSGWESSQAIDGNPGTGWAVYPNVGRAHHADFVLARPLQSPVGTKLQVTLSQQYGSGATIGKFRVSLTDVAVPTALPEAVAAVLRKPQSDRSPEETQAMAAYRRQQSPEVLAAAAAADRAAQAIRALEAEMPTTMVMKELPQPRPARVLHRGEYDKSGDTVPRQLPAFLPPLPEGAPNDRLGLARWLVSGSHPLTARVWVNRAWEKFFGIGLCRTSENFGSQSEWPSHPEMLDWLATEFVRLGWDMKAMQKQIVMSATYRQSAHLSNEVQARDPENRLLARGPRFRLKGEIIRDQALAVSGLLRRQIGGPSVRPYMPEGVWDETSRYGDLRGYQHESGEGLYRRTMYTIWKRSAGPPSLALFDGPNRDVCTVKRSRTNTPTQALALLNEVTFVEAARLFAGRILSEGGATAEERITWAMQEAVARPPTDRELAVLSAGLAKRQASFEADPEKARQLVAFGETRSADTLPVTELAAWTLMANVLMNLDEFVTRE